MTWGVAGRESSIEERYQETFHGLLAILLTTYRYPIAKLVSSLIALVLMFRVSIYDSVSGLGNLIRKYSSRHLVGTEGVLDRG